MDSGNNVRKNPFANATKETKPEPVRNNVPFQSNYNEPPKKTTGSNLPPPKSNTVNKEYDGNQNQFNQLIASIQNGGNQIIPMDEIVNTTKASFAAIESLKTGTWINII